MAIALVLGATGLVGRQLTLQLLEDDHWQEVHVFTRSNTGLQHARLQEQHINFDHPDEWRALVKGDVLFSALGTTLAAAGSKAAQYKVDYTYQYQFAEAGAANGVNNYVLVSASNASLNAPFFYPRMKAALDRDVARLPFKHISIVRPGLLDGARKEKRIGERFALLLARTLHKLPGLGALKPIPGSDVARAMIVAAKTQQESFRIYAVQELFQMAAQSAAPQ